jgi:hypothetical protein
MSKGMLKMHTIKTPTHHVYCGTTQKGHIINQILCPLTNEQMDKMWYVYTMEYFSIMKKNEMSFSEKWMDVEIMILKGEYCQGE